jgi:RarD protein
MIINYILPNYIQEYKENVMQEDIMKFARIQVILAMAIWGSIGLFVRNIPFSSAQIALVRGVVGFTFILVFSIITGRKVRLQNIKENAVVLLFSGIALGLNWILLFQAYKYTSISNATICYYFAPVIIMMLSPIILKEALSVIKVVCIIAALIGLACIAGVSKTGTNDLIGILFGLAAAILYAVVVFLNKKLKHITGIESSMLQLGISAVALFPYVIVSEGLNITNATISSVTLLLVVGVLHTGVVYLIYFSALQKLSAQSAATLSYIDPVVAILLSAIFLHESMSLLQMLGGALILGATFFHILYEQGKALQVSSTNTPRA